MGHLAITVPSARIAEFCREHRIRRLSFFGSVTTGEFRPDSDVDVLVEFEPGLHLTLLDLADMELSLGDLIGRKVDLREPEELSRSFRERVVSQAIPEYVQP